ncbi:MAG: hypothetical protein ACE5JG_12260, partial [Planctomycetota bacterium]
MPVHASAPCRVDLAGGTLDVSPLPHLLEAPAVTVNVAMGLRAHATAEARSDGVITVRSEDLGESVELPAAALSHDRLPLATRLIEWFGPGDGLTLTLRSEVPRGSGLGGSSALAAAIAGCLTRLRGGTPDRPRLITVLQRIEMKILRTPAGYQDYVPALFGGAHAITATPAGLELERMEEAETWLAGRLLLADTGAPHHSGLTNWEVVRRFVEGDAAARDALEGVARVAAQMRNAVRERDLR